MRKLGFEGMKVGGGKTRRKLKEELREVGGERKVREVWEIAEEDLKNG